MTRTQESLSPYVESHSIPEAVGFSHPALVLADPPEAGWRVRTRSNEEATGDTELLAAPGPGASCEHTHSTPRRALYPGDTQDKTWTGNTKTANNRK
jgi:hypothetical protein